MAKPLGNVKLKAWVARLKWCQRNAVSDASTVVIFQRNISAAIASLEYHQ